MRSGVNAMHLFEFFLYQNLVSISRESRFCKITIYKLQPILDA
nr:MAG TPA: hypothetical protein [Caudoviricetes sp.]